MKHLLTHPSDRGWRDYVREPACNCNRCMVRYNRAQMRLTFVLTAVLIVAAWVGVRSL